MFAFIKQVFKMLKLCKLKLIMNYPNNYVLVQHSICPGNPIDDH